MKESFDVITEPWIPVMKADGSKVELSLRGVIENAHEVDEISDASPLIEYGLYRLVITFLMDIFRPREDADLSDLLEDGRFDMDAVDRYISDCRASGVSFDLFDNMTPFLQTPREPEWDKTIRPVAALDYARASGNNHIHFDHCQPEGLSMSFEEAARRLPAIQIFCTAGVQGYPSGVNGAPPYYTLIRGSNLFETLVFSMVPTDQMGKQSLDNPPPWWRSDEIIEAKKLVLQTSWLFAMLFPARRVTLIPEKGRVTGVYLSQGLNYKSGLSWTDPHVGYREIKKGEKTPWTPDYKRSIWRNIAQLIDREHGPMIMRLYSALRGDQSMRIQLYGVETEKAAYVEAMRRDVKLPCKIMKSQESIDAAKRAVDIAERVARALRSSLVLTSDKKNLPPDEKRKNLVPEPIIDSAVQEYYGMCETKFWPTLFDIPDNPDAALDEWLKTVEKSAWNAYGAALSRLRFFTVLNVFKLQIRSGILVSTIYRLKHPDSRRSEE